MEDQLEKIDSDSNSSIEDKIKAYEKIAEELIDECDANKIVAFMTRTATKTTIRSLTDSRMDRYSSGERLA